MYTVYKALEGRKTYLVFDYHIDDDMGDVVFMAKQARKYFKVKEKHIEVELAWIYDDLLYFYNPDKKHAVPCWAAYWIK
ncbi:MAG: hypothetical protein J6S14_14020 [Clostridia bacterium]|nr:hypothetical protein [Clostridia bacterium]